MTAGFVVLNSRSGCILAIICSVIDILAFNLRSLVLSHGHFGRDFLYKQGDSWHCGVSFQVVQILVSVVLLVMITQEKRQDIRAIEEKIKKMKSE